MLKIDILMLKIDILMLIINILMLIINIVHLMTFICNFKQTKSCEVQTLSFYIKISKGLLTEKKKKKFNDPNKVSL